MATVTHFVTGLQNALLYNRPAFCYLVDALYYRVTKCVGVTELESTKATYISAAHASLRNGYPSRLTLYQNHIQNEKHENVTFTPNEKMFMLYVC